jgi:hypothetical protein
MKKMMFSVVVLLLTITTAIAQTPCDKKVVYHSEKQELLDTDGQIADSKTDVVDIEVSKEGISVKVNDKDGELTAAVKEVTCEWKTPYQEGKAVYKVTFAKGSGEASEGSLTIEAKEGKITVLFVIEAMNGKKLRALISNYSEK